MTNGTAEVVTDLFIIGGGINAINPLDASAFNRPGVELKEGQLPVEMLSFSYDLADTLSLEGFYQYNFRPSVLDGVKCVIVDVRLRELEPMAWDFALAFAKDNDLQAFEACEYVPPSGQA